MVAGRGGDARVTPVPPLPPLRFQPARDSAFRRELRARADAYLAAEGRHRFGDWRLHAKTVFLATLTAGLYALALSAGSTWPFVASYVACLVAAMVLAMNTLHDAAHSAVFRQGRLNRVLIRLVGLPVGVDTDFWTIRHVHFHHTYANVEGYDLDTEPNPFLRQTPFQRWSPQYRYQYLYWPVVAALSLPYLNWYGDWLDRFGKTPVAAHSRLQGWRGWLSFLGWKLGHVALVLALPMWVLQQHGIGWGVVLGAYFLGQMLASCALVALILGTHWAEVEFFQPGQDGTLPHDWYQHTFYTACDWTPKPRALRWLGYWLGGLNLHLTHHLFPTWSHRHYPALAHILAELAPRHGLVYRELGYGQLHASQQQFLRAMGQPPAQP